MKTGAEHAVVGRRRRSEAAPTPLGEAEGRPHPTFGGGGPHGSRVYWPAGLAELTPAERADALKRGWWTDGDHIVTRDGQRLEGKPTR
jgi:hypothetical protein